MEKILNYVKLSSNFYFVVESIRGELRYNLQAKSKGDIGFEPMTCRSAVDCSTTELTAQTEYQECAWT